MLTNSIDTTLRTTDGSDRVVYGHNVVICVALFFPYENQMGYS